MTAERFDIEHVIDSDGSCPCGPRVEPVPQPDGSMGWVYVHHSLDGRERFEPPAGEQPLT